MDQTPVKNLNPKNILKVVGKSLATTKYPGHPVPKYCKRLLLEKELELAARSLINNQYMPANLEFLRVFLLLV